MKKVKKVKKVKKSEKKWKIWKKIEKLRGDGDNKFPCKQSVTYWCYIESKESR